MKRILYKKGYKYQLVEGYTIKTKVLPARDIVTDYIGLTNKGVLYIKKGYAWDGPSGPTIDTLNFMRGSLVHDALYQLMREGYFDKDWHRELIDRLLQIICKKDGMSALRAWYVYQAVRLFGRFVADPADKKLIIKAPKSY